MTSPQPRPSAPPARRAPLLETPRLKAFRLHPAGIVLDTPFYPPPGSVVRAATLWPDPTVHGGWNHQSWEPGPGGRGHRLPALVELGDVVAYGAFYRTRPPAQAPSGRGRGRPQPPAEPAHPWTQVAGWCGYLHALEPDSLLLHGPHPDPLTAYAAAQQALLARLHPTTPVHPPLPVEPAQPPATVSVAYHGQTATVGDPLHGWLHVDATDLAAALTLTPADLARHLYQHVRLHGAEPPVVLAALAATHLPDQLPDTATHRPTPPPGPQHTGPAPAAPQPPAPPTPTPTPTTATATARQPPDPPPAAPPAPPAPPTPPTPTAGLP